MMTEKTRRVRYEVRTPLHGASDPWREGRTISRHRTMSGAANGLDRHRAGCGKQGSSEAAIYDTIECRVVHQATEEEA